MASAPSSAIARAASSAADPEIAARELADALVRPEAGLVIVFASADYDLPALGAALKARFAPVPVVGCTTAGEISPSGCRQGSISGIVLCGLDFAAEAQTIRHLASFSVADGQDVVRKAVQGLRAKAAWAVPSNMFAFTLIDGMSGCEEELISSLYGAMGQVPLFGGSAGDCMRFERTHVLQDGRFLDDAALFVLVATTRPFRVFKTEHFVAGSEKVVVTEADPARRIVYEINGEPAAVEYARIVGVDADHLTPMAFANHPVVVRVGGANYVRSIQKMNPDGSLTFFCAIDEGIVLTVARSVDLAENLGQVFDSLRRDIGPPELVLGFDCILRGLEVEEKGSRDAVDRLLVANNVIGFSTYGEQYQAMHVNQTLTGVAIGARDRP